MAGQLEATSAEVDRLREAAAARQEELCALRREAEALRARLHATTTEAKQASGQLEEARGALQVGTPALVTTPPPMLRPLAICARIADTKADSSDTKIHARTTQAEEVRHASTRAELNRAQEEIEEMAAIARRYDAAAARSEGLQRELGEQQAAASREAEAAAAALRNAMETSAGQDAGAKQAAQDVQAAQAAQAAAEQSVRGLQGQVNDLDQKLKQALAQVCRTRKALPEMSTFNSPLLVPQVRMQEDALAQGQHDLEHAQSASAGIGLRLETANAEVPRQREKSAPVARVPCGTQQRMMRSKARAVLYCAGGRAA